MDTTDLQKLIEVIAARLRDTRSAAVPAEPWTAPGNEALSVAQLGGPVTAAGDAAALVAELLSGGTSAKPFNDKPAGMTLQRAVSSVDSDDGGPVERVARSLVSGLGVVSLVKGLFGGDAGSAAAAAPLPKFELPPPVAPDITYSSRTGEYMEFDRPERGGLRTRDAAPPAITVNVQAMDSKSFLDHSHEIARAVREAILNSHSLSDVVSEL
jgi:hypothetical protein